MSGKICPHCGMSLDDDATNCPCGQDLDEMELPGPGVVRDPVSGMKDAPDPAAKPATAKPKKSPQPAAARKQPAPTPVTAKASAAPPKASLHKLMACPSCAARISKRAKQCPKCGASPFLDCQICSSRIVANSTACPECGDPDPFLAQIA